MHGRLATSSPAALDADGRERRNDFGQEIPGEAAVANSSADSQKRYYLASPDLRRDPSDYKFDKSALINGRSVGFHEHLIHGSNVRMLVGVPPVQGQPRLVISPRRNSPIDMYGFGPRFISTPAKNLLSEVDAEAFEFLECETTDSEGNSIEPYWLFDVVRVIHEFDEANSNFVRYADISAEHAKSMGPVSIQKINEIRFLSEMRGCHHAFWLSRYGSYPIFDNEIVDRWRARGFQGVQFTPLQEPTRFEMKEASSFENFPYWSDKVKSK